MKRPRQIPLIRERIPPELREMLDATGLDWTIKTGKKHQKIFLDGRMIGVFSHGYRPSRDDKDFDSIRCAIQRRQRAMA